MDVFKYLMSLQLNKKQTNFTSFDDTVFIDGKYLKREQVWYKQFTSEAQAHKVIDTLIIEQNFIPDFKKDHIVLSNSKNLEEKYYFYYSTFEMEKIRLYVVDTV
tara:strand:+ start:1342 stop:1653 length:312 start_codon:yes stop_codon:yes gene_type:complete